MKDLNEIPECLLSASSMLSSAFGRRISEVDYAAVIFILYDYFSDRNLAQLLSFYTDKDEIVIWNDIGRIASIEAPSSAEVERVLRKLRENGFEKWRVGDE